MAQGFVRNLNLLESSTQVSDTQILDNLGGSGITKDLRLFDGNTKFKSVILNDPNALSLVETGYEQIEDGKTYKIMDLGSRDWTLYGVTEAQSNLVFTATAYSGSVYTGEGGIVREVVGRTDFTVENDPNDGWTIKIILGQGKVAYTDGTLLSVDKGATFPIKAINSDGVNSFQIALAGDTSNTPLAVTGGNFNISSTLYSIDNISFTRSDQITPENFKNIYIEHAQTKNSSEESIIPIEERISNPFLREETINTRLGTVNFKKNNVLLSYANDNVIASGGLRFDGVNRIKNLKNSDNLRVIIGNPTVYGSFAVGYDYEVTDLGTGNWNQVGASELLSTVPDVTSGNFVQNTAYKIKSLGNANIGTNGAFVFSNTAVNGTTHTIDVGPSSGLVPGDKVVYRQGTGTAISNLTPISDTADGVYYIQEVNGNFIKLTATSGGSDVIQIGILGEGGSDYTLTVDPQLRWNAIANTTAVTYAVGSYFTANTNGATIGNSVVNPVIFKATSKGQITIASSKAKAVNPPGLYILNTQTGTATRAFTDPSNPWSEENAYQIAKNPGTLTINALKTESAVAQAQDFNFDRTDQDSYGSFIPNEKYIITEVGSGRDWTTVGWVANQNGAGSNPSEGDSFSATASGSSDGGTGGKARGTPKLIFTDADQDAYEGSGLGTRTATQITDYTHKVPIVVNGETYFLMAKLDSSDLAAGDYKILVS